MSRSMVKGMQILLEYFEDKDEEVFSFDSRYPECHPTDKEIGKNTVRWLVELGWYQPRMVSIHGVDLDMSEYVDRCFDAYNVRAPWVFYGND